MSHLDGPGSGRLVRQADPRPLTVTTHDLLTFDLHEDLISVSEAATLAGVTEVAIRQWKRRGHLEAAGADEFGRPLFVGIAVLRAEAKTRKAARRTPLRVS